jgi:hypothetical protein
MVVERVPAYWMRGSLACALTAGKGKSVNNEGSVAQRLFSTVATNCRSF